MVKVQHAVGVTYIGVCSSDRYILVVKVQPASGRHILVIRCSLQAVGINDKV